MDELYITYNEGHGRMNIHMKHFFPCPQAQFKKLLKIIDLDWQHKEELHEQLKVHFQNRIVELIELREENEKKYIEFKQRALDTQRLIKSRKHPNGVQLTKDELGQARENLKEYKETYKNAFADGNRNLKFKERFENYLEILKSV